MTGVMAMGMTPREVMLQQYGKADDPGSGGRQMPSHYGHAGHRIFTSSSPVGTQILHAAGIALAAKLRGVPEVALVAMGEGSSNQGDVHEALNFAGVHRLPMILLVENNGYAISVPAERETAVRDIAVRAAGYAMPGVIVDGADVIGCYLAARDAVARALAGEGATLIEAKVTRLTGHSSDDQQTKYRSADELAEERAAGPVAPLPRRAAGGRRCWTSRPRRRSRPRWPPPSTTRPTSPRPRRTRTRRRFSATSTPSRATRSQDRLSRSPQQAV